MTRAAMRGIASMATRQLLAELLAGFAQRTGCNVAIESVGGVDAARRVQAGEAFDVVMLASQAIEQLIAAGHLLPGSKVDWVRSTVAVAVRAGAPRPDIRSEQALRQTVLAARSIGLSSGPSGVALVRLFERWGMVDAGRGTTDATTVRLLQAPPGQPVGTLIAAGQVQLGFQQLSELLPVPGITIVGPLPPAVRISTVFSAAVGAQSQQADAARELLAYLASPLAQDAKRRQGMESI